MKTYFYKISKNKEYGYILTIYENKKIKYENGCYATEAMARCGWYYYIGHFMEDNHFKEISIS